MVDLDQKPIEHVLVVGYGVMGRGIAQTSGADGFDTVARTTPKQRPVEPAE
jgi:3-hydroxyacyl-CoA dehydrogenase